MLKVYFTGRKLLRKIVHFCGSTPFTWTFGSNGNGKISIWIFEVFFFSTSFSESDVLSVPDNIALNFSFCLSTLFDTDFICFDIAIKLSLNNISFTIQL